MSSIELVMHICTKSDTAGNSEGRLAGTTPVGCPQRGVILIALLWVLAALSLLALNLSSTVRSELSAASASGLAGKGYFFARGALEAAVYDLVYPLPDPEKQKARFSYRDGMNHFWITNA